MVIAVVLPLTTGREARSVSWVAERETGEEAGGMSATAEVEAVAEVVTSLVGGAWPDDSSSAQVVLERLGFAIEAGSGTELGPGSVLREFAVLPSGIESGSVQAMDNAFAGVILMFGSDPVPASGKTGTLYRELLGLLTELLGPAVRVWETELTPVQWPVGALDVGLQLFDNRDSTVMVWVEHRARAALAESVVRGDIG